MRLRECPQTTPRCRTKMSMSVSMSLPAGARCETLAGESSTHSCQPGGLPAPATPTHTTMPCVHENAIDAAICVFARTGLHARQSRTRT
jgi:hypothetical protein